MSSITPLRVFHLLVGDNNLLGISILTVCSMHNSTQRTLQSSHNYNHYSTVHYLKNQGSDIKGCNSTLQIYVAIELTDSSNSGTATFSVPELPSLPNPPSFDSIAYHDAPIAIEVKPRTTRGTTVLPAVLRKCASRCSGVRASAPSRSRE